MKKWADIIGGIMIALGGGIDIYGFYKHNEANGMIGAIEEGARLFGADSSTYTSLSVWEKEASNARTYLIVGAIVLVIGLCLLIYGITSNKRTKSEAEENGIQQASESKAAYDSNTSDYSKASMMDQLKELDELKSAGYISEDEYEQKRKKILDL